MPWVSKQQAKWGHSPSGLSALGGPTAVKEWDQVTPKGSLPARASKKKIRWPGTLGKSERHAFDAT